MNRERVRARLGDILLFGFSVRITKIIIVIILAGGSV